MRVSHLWATEVSSDRKNESRIWQAVDTDRYSEWIQWGTDQPDGYRTVCGAAIVELLLAVYPINILPIS